MLVIIALLFFLILLNAFFAAVEIAIISTRDTELKPLAEKNVKSAKIILDYHRKPSEFLSTIQVGVTLSGFFISAIAATYIGAFLALLLRPYFGPLSPGIAIVLITLMVSYITLVFAEVLPKNLAIVNPGPIALTLARPLNVFNFFLWPLSKIISFSTNIVIKLLGVEPALTKRTITEEELHLLVAEQQDLNPEEKALIQEALELGDVIIRQIMVPRNDVVAMPATGRISEALDTSNEAGFTRIPVYENDLDNIIGMIHIKDAIAKLKSGNENESVKSIIRPVFYTPETNKALTVLKQLQKSGLHLAVALDEYGGTAGLVTMEDIIEEIVGEIRDEYDMELDLIKPLGKNSFLVQGKVPVEEINDSMQIDIPISPDYETLAGWLIFRLKRIPKQGERVTYKTYDFTVNKMSRNRIDSILIKKSLNGK